MTEPRQEPGTDVEQALAAYLAAQRMTRRQLLERIAAVGAAAALAPVIAACASGPMADAERAAAPAPAVVPTVPRVAPVVPAGPITSAPVQAAAASSHVVARILARIVSRG
jgi:5'-nucleotidase / UDP-sugar diphosphatase